MTRRLYYDDCYTLEFRARVLDTKVVDAGVEIELDETFFYPTSGGQMHDTGSLGGLTVIDVIDREDRIVHIVAGEGLEVGAEVEGSIDADRRRENRQQHTGQHVLSRIIEDQLGLPTISSRLGETMNSLDLETSELSTKTLDTIEDTTNAALWVGHEVKIHFVDAEELERWGLRKKVEREGPARVIEVVDVDRCACGGTHVGHTSEVGEVVLVSTEKVKKLTRLSFVCGERAHRWRRDRHRWLDQTARALSTGHPLVPETVQALLEESKLRHKRLSALARELVATRAEDWIRDSREIEQNGQMLRLVARCLDTDEALAAPQAIHALVATEGVVAALVVRDGDKAQILVGRSAQLDLDCGRLLSATLAEFGAKGGGRPDNARGGFAGADTEAVLQSLATRLESGDDVG